jgi:hypothetical protein
MGCHSHKVDNSMKALLAAFLKAYAERPDGMQVPVFLPHKYQESRVDRGEIVAGVMKGGFDLTFLTSALLEIPNAKESGRQVQWKEFVEIRYRGVAKIPQDESATITFDFETATQEAPGIFGDGVPRPDPEVITKVRKRLAELSTEEFEQAEVLARKGLAHFLVTFQRFAGPQLKSQRGVKQKNSVHLGGSLEKENEGDFEIGQKVPITNDECEGNHGRYKQMHRGVTFVNLDNLEGWALWQANKLNKALKNGEIALDGFYAAIRATRGTMTRRAKILKFAEINSVRTKEANAIRDARLKKVQAQLARLLMVSPCTTLIQVATLIEGPSQFSMKNIEIDRIKDQWAYQRKVAHPTVKFPASSKWGKEQLVDLIMQVVSFDFTTGLPFKYQLFDVAAAAAAAAAAAGGDGGGREGVGEGGEGGGGGSATGGATPEWFQTAEHVDEFMRTTTTATGRGAKTKQSNGIKAQLRHLRQQGVPGCSPTLEGVPRTLEQLVDLLKKKLAERQPTRPEAPAQQSAPPLMDCQVHACD